MNAPEPDDSGTLAFIFEHERDPAPVGPRLCNDPKTIQEKFEAFDAANPEVYRAFKVKALRLLHHGVRRYGAKAIIEVIRYDRVIKAHDPDGFKINNTYVSAYARRFVTDYPQHSHFFQMRKSQLDDE